MLLYVSRYCQCTFSFFPLDYVTGKDVVTKLPPTPGQVTFLNTPQSGDTNNHHPVVYNFHYHDNSHLQTEAKYGMKCPWCSLDCGCLYSLLCHLTLCHPRVTSVYTVSMCVCCACAHVCVILSLSLLCMYIEVFRSCE